MMTLVFDNVFVYSDSSMRVFFLGSSICFLIASWYDDGSSSDGSCGKIFRWNWPHRDEFRGRGRSNFVINNNTLCFVRWARLHGPILGERKKKPSYSFGPNVICAIARIVRSLFYHATRKNFKNTMTLARALSWHTLLSMWMDIRVEKRFSKRGHRWSTQLWIKNVWLFYAYAKIINW